MRNRCHGGGLLAFAFLVGLIPVLTVPLTEDAIAATPVTLEVYNPTGATEVSALHAPRLVDLKGKTICELWDGLWNGNATFPVTRELLQKQFPGVKIIPYTQFPVGAVPIDSDTTAKLIKAKGCEAVIVGNGG
jgi:hypothetical protein